MARQSAGPKARRVLDLLTGLYAPAVRQRLEAHGLSEQELALGWHLLEQFARARRGPELPVWDQRAARLRLDRWENQWFVIADAALAGAFPKLHAWLFRGLSRQSGIEVVLVVETLLDRLDQLEKPPKQYRREAPLARARLAARGLTGEVMREGRQLLAEAKGLANDWGKEAARPTQAEGLTELTEEEAEAKLWQWYLEWSRIARAVLQEPQLLAHLGFSRRGRPRKAARSGASEEEAGSS